MEAYSCRLKVIIGSIIRSMTKDFLTKFFRGFFPFILPMFISFYLTYFERFRGGNDRAKNGCANVFASTPAKVPKEIKRKKKIQAQKTVEYGHLT